MEAKVSDQVSPKTILDLPDVPLLAIFDYIPLLNLLHIDEVCRAWGLLKSKALLRRRQLVFVYDEIDLKNMEPPNLSNPMLRLVKNDDGSPYCKDKVGLDRSVLYYDLFTPMMVDNVIELMPNLKILYIQQLLGTFPELWKIKLLLHHYRHQLEEVNIVFYSRKSTDAEWATIQKNFHNLVFSMVRELNQMTALTTLELNLQMANYMETPVELELNLSVASRLKTMNLHISGLYEIYNDVDVLKHTYEQYCEGNEALQTLNSSNKFYLGTLLAFGPRVTAALQMVHIGGFVSPGVLEDFKLLAQKYSHIQSLSIFIMDILLAHVTEALVPCKNLVDLLIRANFDYASERDVLKEAVEQFPVLPSVKFLTLEFNTASHKDLEQLDLDAIFPNVQVIELRHTLTQCIDCDFQVPEEIEDMPAEEQTIYGRRVHNCMRLARTPFAKFGKLTTMKAYVGLRKINSSFKKIDFTRETLDQETFLD